MSEIGKGRTLVISTEEVEPGQFIYIAQPFHRGLWSDRKMFAHIIGLSKYLQDNFEGFDSDQTDCSVEKHLPYYISNKLISNGISTMGELSKSSYKDITGISGVGRKSMVCIQETLYAAKLPSPEIPPREPKSIRSFDISRYMRVVELREQGKTYREIGEVMEISSSRANQMFYKGNRIKQGGYRGRYEAEYNKYVQDNSYDKLH